MWASGLHISTSSLGHDDAGVVIRVYGNLLPDSEDRIRRAVDEVCNEALAAGAVTPGRLG